MNKNVLIKTIIVILASLAFFSTSLFATVTVHPRINGVTGVSCTGGCTIRGSILGSTVVCDQSDTCITIIGPVKEKIIAKEREQQ